jgi:hypothetical protein
MRFCVAAWLAFLVGMSACSFSSPRNPNPDLAAQPKGPHGGEMLNLGGDELFGEFVHGNGKLTIYLFDDSRTNPAWGDGEELKLIVPLHGDRREFILKSPKKDLRTEYASTDSDLVDAFEHQDLTRVTIAINAIGKAYEMDFDHKPHGATTGAAPSKPATPK